MHQWDEAVDPIADIRAWTDAVKDNVGIRIHPCTLDEFRASLVGVRPLIIKWLIDMMERSGEWSERRNTSSASRRGRGGTMTNTLDDLIRENLAGTVKIGYLEAENVRLRNVLRMVREVAIEDVCTTPAEVKKRQKAVDNRETRDKWAVVTQALEKLYQTWAMPEYHEMMVTSRLHDLMVAYDEWLD